MADGPSAAPVPHRSASVDVLRLVLAYMIIGLHGHFLGDVSPRLRYLLEEGLFRIAVPLFFMISGFFLERGGWRGMRRWLRHLLWLYALWMAVYAAYWLPHTHPTLAGAIIRAIFGYYHLWFLPALAMAGILLMALRLCGGRWLAVLAVLAGSLGLAIQLASNLQLAGLIPGEGLESPYLFRNFAVFGFPFMALGMFLARVEPRLRPSPQILAAALVSGLALLLAENMLNLWLFGPEVAVELQVSLYLLCPAILLWVRRLGLARDGKPVAQMATGIYLVHALPLLWLNAHAGFGDTANVLLAALFSTVAAAVLVVVNRRLPVL